MSEDYYFVKTLGGFKAADERTQDVADTFGAGEIVRVHIYKGRNLQHHRLFFALLGMVYSSQEKYLSLEALRFAIMIQSGYVEEIHLHGDRVVLKPKSISFSKMDQTQFSEFYQAALQAIPALLPQFEGVDLEQELRVNRIA